MIVKDLKAILESAPPEVQEAIFVGIYQHTDNELGVLIKNRNRGANVLWQYGRDNDPQWEALDESRFPQE